MSLELDDVKKTEDLGKSAETASAETAEAPGAERSQPGKAGAAQAMNGPGGRKESGIVPNASGGAPLPDDLQQRFGGALGADVSGVRVHTGASSANASQDVGAKAFAVGQDIHFAPGQYNPKSEGGQRLLAHEVAHTVQQSGGAAAPQAKLQTSQPGDAHEAEADRAADSMMRGDPAKVSTKSAPTIAREKDETKPKDPKEEDQAWASSARPKIQALQDATADAIDRLNADATKAIAGLKKAQDSYKNYEKKYNAALTAFTTGVAAAQKARKELEDNITFVAKTILTAYAPGFMEGMGKVTGYLEKAEKIAAIGSAVGVLPKPPTPEESKKDVGPNPKVDWRGLLDTSINTFENSVKQNKALAATSKKCLAAERFLDLVVEGGKTAPENPRTSEQGKIADDLASHEPEMKAQLAGLGGGLAAPCVKFGNDASLALDGATPRKIEQDIAIKWMSTLTKTVQAGSMQVNDQTEEIDDARSYLKTLGMEDRLGHDAGSYMTDVDQHILWLRAQTEQGAIERVGTTAEWLGGKMFGVSYYGKVRADGVEYIARGLDLGEKPGGYVQVTSYSIRELPSDFSAWSRPNDTEARKQLHDCVTLAVKPLGPMGGGVTVDGPTIKQG